MQGVKGTGSQRERHLRWKTNSPAGYRAALDRQNVKRRVDNPKVQHDVITTYIGAHNRMRRLRGKASNQTCFCGNQARDWAYEKPTGWSTNPEEYTSLCRSCHMRQRHCGLSITDFRARYC